MRFAPNARSNVTVRENKEARLRDFITAHLESHRASGAAAGTVTYRLLALSADSPAARALNALAPDLAAAGIRVEAILCRRTPEVTLDTAECRFATDLRLLDAHEQLVLDRVTAWIGDCMRRDPLKRDAYEHFSDSPATAGHAARSFAQIWRATGPAGTLAVEPRWTGLRQATLFDPSLIAGADGMAKPNPVPHRH
ncbi:MAG: hypothetical protein AB7S70_06515 [Hyphomicrobium sp.]|uniref:hypothetical protein n=1 Tax=Hyphomicrobium sp. TaxID=82 RepID=UPI003D0986E9